MVDFHPIEMKDREWIEPFLQAADLRGSEYSFANSFNWRKVHDIQVARQDGFYFVMAGKGKKKSYLYPIGQGDKLQAIESLVTDARERKTPFSIHGMLTEQTRELDSLFPGRFVFHGTRDLYDYIYSRESLAGLAGKKLHAKRNHINKFKTLNNWSYEPISRENIEQCWEMNRQWCIQQGCGEDPGLREEACAVRSCFEHYFSLEMQGGLLKSDGRVIAYTMGKPLCSDTFIVHIEKAFAEIQGAYPMINQQFVLHACEGFSYINREEDTGKEGLRKAKLSYYPSILLEKYTASLKGGAK